MIDWTDAAIEAALNGYCNGRWRGMSQETDDIIKNQMRAALDAAVKAQSMTTEEWMSGIGYCRGYDDALEEAAKMAESKMLPCDIGGDLILDPYTAETIAATIRALKEKKE